MTKVETIYGDKFWIKLAEYIGALKTGRKLIPTYTKAGKKKYQKKNPQDLIVLHVDNIVSVYE